MLRFEIEARGRMAHSAYPELGESAIEALLDSLERVRRMPLPNDALLGPCTINIGTISGGRAPNVIADAAKAEILVRLVGDPEPMREAFAARPWTARAEAREILCIPAMRFEASMDSRRRLSHTQRMCRRSERAGASRFLMGPGSIHVAHTNEERISKHELAEAVEIYAAEWCSELLATARE